MKSQIILQNILYQSANAVFNKVKGYIDKLAQFTGAKQGDWDIGTADMQTKILELIIPEGASQKQIEQLQLLREYAQQYEIQFTIIIAN